MKVVWKKQLNSDKGIIDIPENSQILCMKLQNGIPTIWFLADRGAKICSLTYKIFGTGHPFEDEEIKGMNYIDTFLTLGDSLVFHVFIEAQA
jgi:hypothetical protein